MKRPKQIACHFCNALIHKRFLQRHFLACEKSPPVPEGQHICSLCGLIKPIDDFPVSVSNPSGKSHQCKTCTQNRQNHWRRLNKDRVPPSFDEIKMRPRAWKLRPCRYCGTKYNFRAMHAHVLVCDGRPNRPRRPDNPFIPDMEKILNDTLVKDKKLEQRARNLWSHYGITISDYDRIFAEQNGKCAICQGPPTAVRGGRIPVFVVDHCHSTGKIRGLICGPCNHGLGHFRDKEDMLVAASAYVVKYRALHAAEHKN